MDSARNINDLVQTLGCAFELDEIKELIKNKLQNMDNEEVRCVCMQSVPLDYIISNDAMQSILSHIPFQRTVKLVNKNFNAVSKRNEALNLDSNQTDWLSVVKQKGKEIKRLEELMAETVRKHETLIDDTKLHLKQLVHENTGSHEYCNKCRQLVPADEMEECCAGYEESQVCSKKNKECSSCIMECESEDCDIRLCSECKFQTTTCGMEVCDNCHDYHYKYCGCTNNPMYWDEF